MRSVSRDGAECADLLPRISGNGFFADIIRGAARSPSRPRECGLRSWGCSTESGKSDAGGRHQRRASKEASEELGQN
jgi:hypothetical protein